MNAIHFKLLFLFTVIEYIEYKSQIALVINFSFLFFSEFNIRNENEE